MECCYNNAHREERAKCFGFSLWKVVLQNEYNMPIYTWSMVKYLSNELTTLNNYLANLYSIN